ncbi:MAG: hypothetical protein QF886_16255, partial [Planctomycetota bacterium]|nr:hypothetical protein [Planctomycetota bacterium]
MSFNTTQLTPSAGHHYFGYYDKCPWDGTGRYFLSLEIDFIDRPPVPGDVAVIGMVDNENDEWIPVAETEVWNWQQGTMLQWLGSEPDRKIVYNSEVDGRYVSIVQDVFSGETKTMARPIYALSPDGSRAVTLNFSRVHRCRPGYGYEEYEDDWASEDHPAEDGIYGMDMASGDNQLIISLEQIVRDWHDSTMDGVQHWFNHLQFCRDGSRFLFLHRWTSAKRRHFTRLFTANPDGSGIRLIADHELVSHFDWRDDAHILAWARQNEIGDYFFLFTDGTDEKESIGKDVMIVDGHCSYSPDSAWILNDTYPDKESKRTLFLYHPASN